MLFRSDAHISRDDRARMHTDPDLEPLVEVLDEIIFVQLLEAFQYFFGTRDGGRCAGPWACVDSENGVESVSCSLYYFSLVALDNAVEAVEKLSYDMNDVEGEVHFYKSRKVSDIDKTGDDIFFTADVFIEGLGGSADVKADVGFVPDNPGKLYAFTFYVRLAGEPDAVGKM